MAGAKIFFPFFGKQVQNLSWLETYEMLYCFKSQAPLLPVTVSNSGQKWVIKKHKKRGMCGGILLQAQAVNALDIPVPETASRSQHLIATDGAHLHEYAYSLFNFKYIFILNNTLWQCILSFKYTLCK